MTLQLVKEGSIYKALTSSAREGSIVKAAGGFRYNAADHTWTTTDPRKAALLREFANAALQAEIDADASKPVVEHPLIRLVKVGGEYHAITRGWDANPVVKAAGFRWRGDAKVWATSDLQKAAKLAQFAEDGLRATLLEGSEKVTASARIALETSRSVDADIEIPVPAGLSYLGYQKGGINYALRQFDVPGIKGVLIGDDMGLGKTIQSVGVSNARPDVKRVIIVCPASLKLNWAREWRRWTARPMSVGVAKGDWMPGTDVVILNYEIAHTLRPEIDKVEWDMMIIDEAQALKNAKAQRTAAILGGTLLPTKEQKAEARARRAKATGSKIDAIKARMRLFLTGTPIMNRPVEMWNIVQSCDPSGLGANFFDFARRYCDAERGDYGWNFNGASNLGELQTNLRSRFMVRRLKADVLTELPPKRRQLIEIAANGASAAVEAEKTAVNALQVAVARAEGERLLAEILADEAGYNRAVNALKAAKLAEFTEMSRLRHETALKKVPYCIEHIRDAIESSGKVIVFAHHADVIAAFKAEFSNQAVVVTGQTPIVDRQAAVDGFQTDPGVTVFIGNILAAGVGLTLTASAHVIFCELDWRPGMVSQAEDRAHRIGQRNSVLVQHIVFEDSIDAVMAQRIILKQEIIDRALDVDGADLVEDDSSDVDAVLVAMETSEEEDRSQRVAEAIARAGAGREQILVDNRPRWQIAEERREQRWIKFDVEAAAMTPEQIESVQDGLQILSDMDNDRAMEANGVGFNKGDSYAGNALAGRDLTPRQAAGARSFLRKYSGQIGKDLVEAMG